MNVTILHNPRCSKSRQTLELLRSRGIEPEIIEYLQQPPDQVMLASLLQMLDTSVTDIMRTGEAAYRDNRERLAEMSAAEKIAWLSENPTVLQRPIVIADDRARIGRPPEAVLDILG